MKRPDRKRLQRHRKATPPPGVDLGALAERVSYVGSAEHKGAPSFAGRPAPRADASICDPSLNNQQEMVQSWLRTALKRGDCGSPWENGFPRYVWHRQGEALYEARLTNRQSGEYKGYPIGANEWPL
jgi:hypothetical protein